MTRPRGPWRIDPAGAVYGQILAIALVAALSESHGVGVHEIVVSVLITMVIFWLAHVYAQAVALRLSRVEPLVWSEVREIAVHESAILYAALPAVLALTLGWIGVIGIGASIRLAIAIGVLGLVAWGFVIARRSRMSAWGTVGAVVVNAFFGGTVVLLKIVIH